MSSYLNIIQNNKPSKALSLIKSRLSIKNAPVEILFRNKKSLTLPNPSLKNLQLIDGFTASELKRKFFVPGSKTKILEELVKEYKKGNLSMSGISKTSKYKEQELDQEKLNKIIRQYKKVRKKSIASINEMKYSDKDSLKRKFSLAGSKGRVFTEMIEDFRNGKISLTKLTHSKTYPKKFNKDQMNELLKVYEDSKKRKRVYFPSKVLTIKSFYDDLWESKSKKDKFSEPYWKDKYESTY
ncbi:uncharacterized protein LOC132902872 [Amyelois transitella]|uniref:uncharacterized protein LOC132902872 n=1 Tax=Amyelois transitella TaxID=680683 RepID=UPI00298F8BB3|nr:uncharacterized protein LOC132902872 [Amyelois transitella]